jgi:hypothetical protein
MLTRIAAPRDATRSVQRHTLRCRLAWSWHGQMIR